MARVRERADVFLGHPMISRVNQLLHRKRAIPGIAHRPHVLRCHPVVARPSHLVGRQTLVSERRKLANVLGCHAVVPQLDERRQRPEPVAQCSHLLQIGELHAMLTRANELGGLRLCVTLPVELVDKRVADIVPSQLVLLDRRRSGEAALGQLRRKIRIGRE